VPQQHDDFLAVKRTLEHPSLAAGIPERIWLRSHAESLPCTAIPPAGKQGLHPSSNRLAVAEKFLIWNYS
jgi:hypothetical protein